jgi:hypothetical protein
MTNFPRARPGESPPAYRRRLLPEQIAAIRDAKRTARAENEKRRDDTPAETARKEVAARQSVEAIAPAVFGRRKDGLILDLGNAGHRGDWAK